MAGSKRPRSSAPCSTRNSTQASSASIVSSVRSRSNRAMMSGRTEFTARPALALHCDGLARNALAVQVDVLDPLTLGRRVLQQKIAVRGMDVVGRRPILRSRYSTVVPVVGVHNLRSATAVDTDQV